MYEKFGSKKISIKQAKVFLYEWRILKSIRPIIIKELELLGLVERVNKKNILLNESDFDEEDLFKYYSRTGVC